MNRRSLGGFSVGVLLGVLAILLEAAKSIFSEFHMSRWVIVGLVGAGAFVALVSYIYKIRQEAQARATREGKLLRLGPPLPRLADLDPYQLGTKSSEIADHYRVDDARPPYVPRDIDRRLKQALQGKSFIIVAGSTGAGKSRSAFEAAAQVFDDVEVVIPSRPSVLRDLLELDPPLEPKTDTAILWLDDLQDFLDAQALDIRMIENFQNRRKRVIVLATIRRDDRSRLLSTEGEIGRTARDVLIQNEEGFETIELGTTATSWDHAEAERHYPDHEHLFEKNGIGAYFTSKEQLIAKYRDEGERAPVGVALVRAAVDWRRTGMMRPLPDSGMRELSRTYFRGALVTDMEYGDARRWANERLPSSARLLEWVEDVEGEGFEASDAVIEYDDVIGREIPIDAWNYVIECASPAECLSIASAAYTRKSQVERDDPR